MQDRLKFKYFYNNTMCNVVFADFVIPYVDILCNGELIHLTKDETKLENLIQCTGLKDKKGELVYFNDFIKLDDGIVCIVKQIEDINDIEYGRVVAIPVFCLNQKYQTQYIPTVIAEGEKVGNLYENPELLESEVE